MNQGAPNAWYPPLEKTLSYLSKLYRCLEPVVFTGLAQVLDLSILTSYGILIIVIAYLAGLIYTVCCDIFQEAVEVCSTSIQVRQC